MEDQTRSQQPKTINLNTSLETPKNSTRFYDFHPLFKIRQSFTHKAGSEERGLLKVRGHMVYNNGLVVPLSITHQKLASQVLNDGQGKEKSQLVFCIDQNLETLAYTGVINGVKTERERERRLEEILDEVRAKIKRIVPLFMVAGLSIDIQTKTMAALLYEKKILRNKLMELLNNNEINKLGVNKIVKEENGVFYFKKGEIKKLETNGEKGKRIDGGYFTIEYVTVNFGSAKQPVRLVEKTLKTKRQQQQQNNFNFLKLKKEIQIVESIEDKTYLIKYYCEQGETIDKVYMDPYDHSLQQYIYYTGQNLQISHKIQIAIQVVDAVLSLHKSQVVHRDVKPSNFLISDRTNTGRCKYTLKIIDFAQSYSPKINNYKGDYACSHPYSPLQCSQKKGFDDDKPQIGLASYEIDYWSVGVTVYEIFFRRLPVSFSRAFLTDISMSWQNEMLLAINQRQKIGLAVVEDIITIICLKMMKFKQGDRLNLGKMRAILQKLEEYVTRIVQLIPNSNLPSTVSSLGLD